MQIVLLFSFAVKDTMFILVELVMMLEIMCGRQISLASVTLVSFGLLRHPSSRIVQEALFNQHFKVSECLSTLKVY